jgi:hypothetical protein
MRRTLSSAALAVAIALTNSAVALAAESGNSGHDPHHIGSSIKDLVMPNVKDLWIVGLIVCLFGAIFTRRGNKAIGILAVIAGAGLVIFNTTGASSMMQNIAHSVL